MFAMLSLAIIKDEGETRPPVHVCVFVGRKNEGYILVADFPCLTMCYGKKKAREAVETQSRRFPGAPVFATVAGKGEGEFATIQNGKVTAEENASIL